MRPLVLSPAAKLVARVSARPITDPTPVPVTSPSENEPVRPWLTLPPGSRYFEREGIRAPVLMRNVSAPAPLSSHPCFAQRASPARP